MIRKIIRIDENKCNGCGACASACHEGAIGIVNGKARLLREDYCDGLGDCLPACPADAISFEEREAPAYDEAAVLAAKAAKPVPAEGHVPPFANWPVQLRLAPTKAPYFDGAELLVAADCAAFRCAGFHRDFIGGRAVLIGCPKLDPVDYSEKLSEIFRRNEIRAVLVARMEVPCCGGLENAVRRAALLSGKELPVSVAVISTEGKLLRQG